MPTIQRILIYTLVLAANAARIAISADTPSATGKTSAPQAGFAALTAAAQLFIQAFRGDSTLIFNGLRRGRIIAWFMPAAIFVLFEYRLKEKHEG